MRLTTTLAGLVLCAACTSPDVTVELDATGALLQDTRTKLEPGLKRQAALEFAQAEAVVIAEGNPTTRLEGCEDTDGFLLVRECRVVSTVTQPLVGPVNATQILVLLDAFGTYLNGVKLIATSADTDRVTQSSKALLDTLKKVPSDGPEVLLPLSKAFEGKEDAIAQATGFLTERARINSLRRIVGQADRTLGEDLAIAASFYPSGEKLDNARLALLEADAEAKELVRAGDVVAYRQARALVEQRHKTLIEMQTQSPGYALSLLREAHGEMKAKLDGRANLEEVLVTLQEIEQIVPGFRGEQ